MNLHSLMTEKLLIIPALKMIIVILHPHDQVNVKNTFQDDFHNDLIDLLLSKKGLILYDLSQELFCRCA